MAAKDYSKKCSPAKMMADGGGVMGIVKRDLGRLADKVNPFKGKAKEDAPKPTLIEGAEKGLDQGATKRRLKEAGAD